MYVLVCVCVFFYCVFVCVCVCALVLMAQGEEGKGEAYCRPLKPSAASLRCEFLKPLRQPAPLYTAE